MNTRARRRLIVVTLVIVVVAILILAVAGSTGAAKTISVTDAASGSYSGKRVQVSGTVVDGSYTMNSNGMDFEVSDPDDTSQVLHVSYEGSIPSTFGNGVTAISTGKMQSDGTLLADELLTKCPSKYESAEGALTVTELYGCGDSIIGTEVQLSGTVKAGTLSAVDSGDRFSLETDGDDIAVVYDGALPDTIADGSSIVATGTLEQDGKFHATAIAEEAE